MSRILIETIVRRTLKDIKEAPERSIRNLLDMALQFSKGGFQEYFLTAARKMLEDENSAYYGLIRDVVSNVDGDRLLQFGMNAGYNSCTMGARRIREQEKMTGYNIPWALLSILGDREEAVSLERYQEILTEGMDMGIFTWLFFLKEDPERILPVVEAFPDCAFVLFCRTEELTEAFLDRISGAKHVLLIIRYDENADEMCSELRSREMLYGLYYPYEEPDVAAIADGELILGAQQLHPVITVLVAGEGCRKDEKVQQQVAQLVQEARTSQKYQTILWELYGDHCLVDEIISGDSCFACFDETGSLMEWEEKSPSDHTIQKESLDEIFSCCFSKKHQEQHQRQLQERHQGQL